MPPFSFTSLHIRLIFLVLLCVLPLLGLTLYLFVLRPINQLLSSAKRIAAGDLSTRTCLPQGAGKLSQLAYAFDKMAESVERHQTERQRVEAELRRANKRFELACAAVSSNIYDWDIKNNTIERTQGLFNVLGYRPEEAESSSNWWFERIHPDDQQRVREQIAAALANPILDFAIEYRICNKDNQYLYVWDKGLIVRNALGCAERVVGSTIDISDRKQAEAEIKQLNETLEQRVRERTAQLEDANKELDAFSYSISHDLRAPLRHIKGFVNALAQQLERSGANIEPGAAHYIQVIQDSSQKMEQLIDGLLTLSRVGRRQLANHPVNLRSLVDSSVALIISQTQTDRERPIEFTIGNLPTVMGDPTLLQQVFTNLIDNAVKFSRDRHPARIEIGNLPDGTIFVKDNGVGFKMEYAEQVFGAFQRLHSPREFPGTGIGLAIVQRIIHRHGGTIWAETTPNWGATFYFKLRSEASGITLLPKRGKRCSFAARNRVQMLEE